MKQLRFGDTVLKESLERQEDTSARQAGRVAAMRRRLEERWAESIAVRCRCGLWPWEHTRENPCGPVSAYRRHRLAKLYRLGFSLRGTDIEAVNRMVSSKLSPLTCSDS